MNAFPMVWDIAQTSSSIIVTMWIWMGIINGWKSPFVRELWYLCHYFCVPVMILSLLGEIATSDTVWERVWGIVLTILYCFIWFIHRNDNDDDDRWKRRRKKSLAKVKQIGGKLVVVPIPVPVRT